MKNHQEISLGFTHKHFDKGAHIFFLFIDELERRRIVSKYIESGLLNNEKIGYFVDTMTPDEFKTYLGEIGIEIPSDKKLMITKALPTYCPTGKFIPEQMFESLREFHRQSIAEGFAGARLSGEMSWALRGAPGSDRLIEYEALLNNVILTYPVTGMCQYDANKFDGGIIYEALRVHPLIIVRDQIVKNPAYMTPEEFLKEYQNRKKHLLKQI